MKSIIERVKKFINNKEVQIFLIGLIIGTVAFNLPENTIRPDLDKSWMYGMNYFFINHLEHGKDIIWPYGPLGFILFPSPLWTYKYSALFYFSLSCFFCYFSARLFYEAKDRFKFIMPITLIIIYFFAAFSGFVEQMMFIPVITLLLYHITKKKRWYYLTCIFSSVAFMLKTGLGAINAVVLFVYTIYLIYSKLYKNCSCGGEVLTSSLSDECKCADNKKEILFQTLNVFKMAVLGCMLYFLILIFIWFAFYQNISGLFNYIFWQTNLSFGYPHTLFYVFNANYKLIILSVLFFIILPFFFKDKDIRVFHIIIVTLILLFMKYSMVRHLAYIFPFLYAVAILYLLFIKKFTKQTLCYFFLIILLSVPFTTKSDLKGYSKYIWNKISAPSGSGNVYNELLKPDVSAENAQMLSNFAVGFAQLSNRAKEYINNHSIDVYPFENTFVYYNNLNWTPRFLFHGYMTYTPELDEKNVEFLSSNKAPDYILWHKTLSDFDGDFAKRGVLSFDRKYLFNDDPQTMQAFLNYYGEIKDFDNVFILKRLENPINIKKEHSESFIFKYNEWISVPQNDDITLLSLKFNHTPYGKIAGIFGENAWAYIDYEFFDNTITRYKLSSIDNLEAGMWVNPHIWEIKENFKTRKVKRIRITVDNPKTLENKIYAKWIFIAKNPNMWLITDFKNDSILNNIQNYSNFIVEDNVFIKNNAKNKKKNVINKDITLNKNTNYILKIQGTAFSKSVLYPKIAAAKVYTNCDFDFHGNDFMLIFDNHIHEYNFVINNQNECKLKEVNLKIQDNSIRFKNNFKFRLYKSAKK